MSGIFSYIHLPYYAAVVQLRMTYAEEKKEEKTNLGEMGSHKDQLDLKCEICLLIKMTLHKIGPCSHWGFKPRGQTTYGDSTRGGFSSVLGSVE